MISYFTCVGMSSWDAIKNKMVADGFCTADDAASIIRKFNGFAGSFYEYRFRMTKHSTDKASVFAFTVSLWEQDGTPTAIQSPSQLGIIFTGKSCTKDDTFCFPGTRSADYDSPCLCVPAISALYGSIDGMYITPLALTPGAKYLVDGENYFCTSDKPDGRRVLVKWEEPETAV